VYWRLVLTPGLVGLKRFKFATDFLAHDDLRNHPPSRENADHTCAQRRAEGGSSVRVTVRLRPRSRQLLTRSRNPTQPLPPRCLPPLQAKEKGAEPFSSPPLLIGEGNGRGWKLAKLTAHPPTCNPPLLSASAH
jgi:hypothetical protein